MFKEKFIKINGKRFHFVEAGKGEPLILIHGLYCSWRIYKPHIPSLSRHFHLFVPDLPGFGKSEVLEKHTLEDFAEVLYKFIKKEKIGPANLFGFSGGGTICLKFGILYPKLTLKISIQGAPWYHQFLRVDKLNRIGIFLFKILRSGALIKFIAGTRLYWKIIGFIDPNRKRAAENVGLENIFVQIKELSPRAVKEWVEDLLRVDLREELKKLNKKPIQLLLGGDDSFITSESIREFKEILPQAKVTVVSNENHELTIDNPKSLIKNLINFLKEKE